MPTAREELEQLRVESSPQRAELERLRAEQSPEFYDPLAFVNPVGAVDAMISTASGIVGEVAGGIVGVASLPWGVGQAVENIDRTREAISFDPVTDYGKAAKENIVSGIDLASSAASVPVSGLVGISALPAGLDTAAQSVRDVQEKGVGSFSGDVGYKIGGPVGGAAGEVLPVAVLTALGLRGVRGKPAPKGATAAKPAPSREVLTGVNNEVRTILKREKINVSDASPENIQRIRTAVADDIAVQQERIRIFEEAGLVDDLGPTRAQITRTADDFQAQQEAAKQSTAVRARLEAQEGKLSSTFDDAIEGTGGEAVASTSTAVNEVVNRSVSLDKTISGLYKQVRETASGAKIVKLDGLVSLLNKKSGSNAATGGLLESIMGDLKSRGIVNKKGKVVGRIDVTTAEEVRKFINTHQKSTNDFGRGVMRELKDALDNDVFSVAGKDVFNQARSAKAKFERDLNRAKVSKFDKNKKNLVRDTLENKIDPDHFVDTVIFKKRYRASDLKQLKDYLVQTKSGLKSFDDLRAQTLQEIKRRAFTGPADAAGNQAITRASLESSLKTIGRERMKILFTPEELKIIDTVVNVTRLREPVRGTAIGRGPSAQAISRLEKAARRSDTMNIIIEVVTQDMKGKAALRTPDIPAVSTRVPVPIGREAAIIGTAEEVTSGGRGR